MEKEKLLASGMERSYEPVGAGPPPVALKPHKTVDRISAITCILMSTLVVLILIVLWLPLGIQRNGLPMRAHKLLDTHACSAHSECNIQLVESIPFGLNYTPDAPLFLSTYAAWSQLLDLAEESVNIGSFYWTLRGVDVVNHSSAAWGEDIFERILSNAKEQKLKIQIAQSVSTPNEPNLDTRIFVKRNAANVRSVDFPRLVGGGVLHTKLWVVDEKHFYVGSANMDWRALTQVKEVGILAQNCSCLAKDVSKIFNAYWYLGTNTSTIPKVWPSEYDTNYNWEQPMIVEFNKSFIMPTLFSSSPPPLVPKGRTHDLESILNIISTARSFINIAVMDYEPLMLYTKHIKYWPYIDDALRAAAIERQVALKLLISWWPHSRPSEDYFLKSLKSLKYVFAHVDIQIRRFVVPSSADQSRIPFTRVNHNKYMVTDNVAYIGTSNWSGDYFTNTAGIGMIFKDAEGVEQKKTIRTDLLSIFERDWNSPYAVGLIDPKDFDKF